MNMGIQFNNMGEYNIVIWGYNIVIWWIQCSNMGIIIVIGWMY